MKKLFLTLSCIVAAVLVNAQNTPEFKCGTMEYLQKQKEADPGLEQRMLLYEEQIQQWISQNSKSNKLNKAGTITIPVVVHIIWKTTDENISDERVTEQIDFSNRDFAGGNTISMGGFSSDLKANTNIQFCLAKKTPGGQATSGIERRETTVDYFSNNAVKYYSSGGMDAWDPTRYMNIWVCNTASTFSGYAQFPGTGSIETYGVVVTYKRFGKVADENWNNGNITTHEFGHCFNLRHIWADDQNATAGTCSGTDYCDDTPNQAIAIGGSPSGLLTDECTSTSPGIMYMNFMDYTMDIVKANLTPDQSTRMHASFEAVGHLISLANSDACSEPSACETPTRLRASSINSKSAVLSWTAMYNNANSYNIQYRKVGASSWTSTTSSTNSTSISGLSNNTSYEFQVKNNCGSNGNSGFSASYVFTHSFGSGKGGGGGKANANNNALEEELVFGNAETNNLYQLVLYPNPANEFVTIKFVIQSDANAIIRLIDITGRPLISELFTAKQGENNYTHNLIMVNKGLYFIEFTIEGHKRIVKKLMVE